MDEKEKLQHPSDYRFRSDLQLDSSTSVIRYTSVSMSQFYSLWSFYWSCMERKCQDYDQSRVIGTSRKCETQAWPPRIEERAKLSSDPKDDAVEKSSVKNFEFPNHQQIGTGMNPMSRNSTVLPSTCPRCNFHSRSPMEIHLHWSRHGKHVCSICGRSFAQKANRDRHMCLHTGARPYPCDICGEKFSRGDKLKIHKNRSHGLKH